MAPKKKKAAPSAGPALESKARTSSKGKRKENADGDGDVIEKEGETNTAGADSSVIPAPAENQVTSADELKSEVLEADVAVSTIPVPPGPSKSDDSVEVGKDAERGAITPVQKQSSQGLISPHPIKNIQKYFNNNILNPLTSLLPDRFSAVEHINSEGRLENELWPGYDASSATFERTFTIMLIVSERCKAGVILAPFDALTKDSSKDEQLSAEAKCEIFFEKVANMILDDSLHKKPQLLEPYAHFLTCAFRNLEDVVVKKNMLRYLSLPIWEGLSESRLSVELQKHPQVAKFWKGYTAKLKACEKAAATAEEPMEISSATPSTKKQKKGGKAAKKATENTSVVAVALEGSTIIFETMRRDATWMPTLLRQFLDYLNTYDDNPGHHSHLMVYFERFLELLVDLLSQVPTRKFLRTLLDDMHFLLICKYCILRKSDHLGKKEILVRLLSSVESYMFFEFDDQSGQALSSQKMLEDSNARNQRLQQVAYSDFNEVLQDLVFSSVGELNKREVLCKHLDSLDDDQLQSLAEKLHVLTEKDTLTLNAEVFHSREMVYELFVERYVARPRQLNELNMLSLYPTEDLLWDSNQIPRSEGFSGNEVLALPKLNLQFLTVSDYLLRNFLLFRMESAYEIREDLADAIKRMGPKQQQFISNTSGSPKVTFSGWARMALPITSTSIDEVSKPRLGEAVPAHVDCTVTIDLSRFTGEIRNEWEDLKSHDVVFLVCIESPQPHATAILAEFDRERKQMAAGKKPKRNRDFQWLEESLDFPSLFGIKYVRGGEIFEVRDEENVVLNDFSRPDERKSGRSGNKRKLRLHLDPAQYYNDIKEGRNCYETMNLIVRRRPKENNFKAILETIRDLMNAGGNTYSAFPNWLHDVFLGFGNPKAAVVSGAHTKELDYRDTFLDPAHVVESFPSAASIVFETPSGEDIAVVMDNKTKPLSEEENALLPSPPYRLSLSEEKDDQSSGVKRKTDSGQVSNLKVRVKGHKYVNSGPYPEDKPPTNTVRFTPTQINAIRSATSEGLTMIVGPPGTGKTDVAVQVIANLYHTHQTEKILIVTHSNAALNDLFEKIMMRDVAPRHLLRLGTGEAELRREAGPGTALAEGEVFSKQGRVNWSLARRIKLLSAVSKLGASLGIPGDVGSSCETAEYFFLEQIQSRLEKFYIDVKALTDGEKYKQFSCFNIQQLFPFNKYFNDTPAPLFSGDWAADLESAEGCFNHIRNIFSEISDYRAFEVLRSQSLRSDYLLTKQARIVAMTCTHAAMTRRRLIELGFKYDSIIMEESAQILEVESLIPMLLQDCDPVDKRSRLKRVVLLGDHQQLPPVVKHSALRQFSHLDQSLFTRFVRLGVPSILLDRQGRARPEIAALYSWKYKMVSTAGEVQTLGDLSNVRENDDFQRANAGFLYTHQLIDVPNFQGKGETCPTPYFFQNLGEAEYIVAVYQYMRLLGYPASKISILTTYNGQKSLIRDILAQRCKNSDLFGWPASVSTVDQYQGQQNDYILLSLVRTQSVGHLQDVRRLIVALSRARLGLYVFCRQSLFQGHRELVPAMSKLVRNHSTKNSGEARSTLQLVAQEFHPTVRGVQVSPPPEPVSVEGVVAMGQLVYELAKRAKP